MGFAKRGSPTYPLLVREKPELNIGPECREAVAIFVIIVGAIEDYSALFAEDSRDSPLRDKGLLLLSELLLQAPASSFSPKRTWSKARFHLRPPRSDLLAFPQPSLNLSFCLPKGEVLIHLPIPLLTQGHDVHAELCLLLPKSLEQVLLALLGHDSTEQFGQKLGQEQTLRF